MHQQALRTVLLIQAIEETDRTGEVIPLADRAEASRAVVREAADVRVGDSGASLSTQSRNFLQRRAERLLQRLRARSPVVIQVLTLAGGLTLIGRLIAVLAFCFGVSLATLDGSRRINILAFPLLGLVIWNLFMYLLLLVAWLRFRGGDSGGFWSATLYERWIGHHVEELLRHATRFNIPLTTALRRFLAEWSAVSRPMWLLRAKRLLHVSAALVAIGLIGGLYVRGIVLRYEAGWESTFLHPEGAHALLKFVYGPASHLSGIPIGSVDEIRAVRWTAHEGGGEAAAWIHLIALTAAIYIVIPRLLAASAASIGLWRFSRNPPLPPGLLGYARALIIGTGGSVRGVASVIPYAYEPSAESKAGLEALLAVTLGANLQVQVREPVRYGEEEGLRGSQADWNVILMTLAATPEVENHGALLGGFRDWMSRNATAAPLLVVIDEAAYGARMRGDAGLEQRLADRRKLWREFVAGYALRACIVDLTQMRPGTTAEASARDAARAALWTASEK